MTSVSNPTVNAAHHAKKLAKSTHSAAPIKGGEGFGDMFGSLQAGTEGQNLAAQTGKASPPTEGLASQILGPSVRILTSTSPTTSDDSLYAFARAQGMDEAALALIFQQSAQQAQPQLPVADSATGLADAANAEAETAENMSLIQQRAELPALAAAALHKDNIPDVQTNKPTTDADGMSTLDLGADGSLRWALGQSAAAKTDAVVQNNSAQELASLHARQVAMSQKAALAAATENSAPEPARDLAATLILSAKDAAPFGKLMQARQASQRAERLANLTGEGFRSVAATNGLMGDEVTREAATTIDSLELGTDLTGQDLQLAWLHRQASTEPGSEGANQGTGQAAANQSDIDSRQQQYEKLSQRLGQALGQRLAAQIARGDWEVKLALKPQDLGNIEIKLGMKDGNLEASFNASEAITRDLITEGLPRLKEALANSGMDVANVNVNVRQEGQNGGKSTPWRPKTAGGINGVSKSGTANSVLPTDSLTTRKPTVTNDGLDILV